MYIYLEFFIETKSQDFHPVIQWLGLSKHEHWKELFIYLLCYSSFKKHHNINKRLR